MYSILRLKKAPPIIWLWIGQGVSSLGMGVYTIALSWEVIRVTGSAFSMGLVLFVAVTPKVILSLFAGVLGDRISKRKILLFSDLCRAVITILWGATLFYHEITLVEIYIFSLIFGIISAFFVPVYNAMIPELIGESGISRAVSINALVFRTAGIISPALSGIMISFLPFSTIIIINGLTFGIAFIMNLLLPVSNVKISSKNSIINDFKIGFIYFYKKRELFWSVILITLANIAVVSYQVSLAKLIQVDMGWKSSVYGFTMSFYTIGSILSSIFFAFLKQKKYKGLTYITSLLLGGVCFFFIPFAKNPLILAIVFFAIGSLFSITSIISTTILFEYSEDIYRSRVMGIAGIASLLSPVGFLIWGIVADNFNNYYVFIIASFLIIIISIFGYFTKLAKV